MPRKGRLVLPDISHYIYQSGHNHQQVFTCRNDYQYYLDTLWEWEEELACQVHAYCLLENQVHLIVNPGHAPENLGKLMKRVAGRQTRYMNRLLNRSGSLWDGRYKSSPVEQGEYLRSCIRYIETIPVRKKIIQAHEAYSWSTNNHMENKAIAAEAGLELAEQRLRQVGKQHPSREMMEKTLEEFIQAAIRAGYPIGSEEFLNDIRCKYNVSVNLSRPGRPKKSLSQTEARYASC